ncbi:MAG: hypothetical protein DMF60_12840, partial [Acidobacteria bacterium]
MTSAPQSSRNEAAPQYAQVAVAVHLTKTYTYRLTAAMQKAARPGSRVVVQLGRQPTTGYIVALLPHLRTGTSLIESEIKEVQELLDVDPPLVPEVLEITRWVADYYAAPWGEVMRAALPAGINASVEQTVSITPRGREQLRSERPAVAGGHDPGRARNRALQLLAAEGEFEVNAFCLRMGASKTPKWLREMEQQGSIARSYRTRSTPTRAKRRRAVRLVKAAVSEAATDAEAARPRVTEAQKRLLETLRVNSGEMAVSDLIRTANVSESAIHTLLKRGVIEAFEEDVRRDPLALAELPDTEVFKLTKAQADALQAIETQASARNFATMLLHGVTGSGKTEVYIRAMHDALKMGQGAMMLVPEIALTPILSRRLRAHFGDQIAIFHSSLSKGERFDEWSRLRSGEARIVLGTRSAIFAPVQNLALIIVDEEHDTSYRQEESPFYNARDTAIVRAQKESAVVVLGSATPSL